MNQTKTTKNNSNETTTAPSVFEELAAIVHEDDVPELLKDMTDFVAQTNNLIQENLQRDAEKESLQYWATNKKIMWNNYAIACIEEKLNRLCRLRPQ